MILMLVILIILVFVVSQFVKEIKSVHHDALKTVAVVQTLRRGEDIDPDNIRVDWSTIWIARLLTCGFFIFLAGVAIYFLS